eukprot:6490407-Prymnesium_polylepis.1
MGSVSKTLKARVGSVNASSAAAATAACAAAAAVEATGGERNLKAAAHPLSRMLDQVLAEVKGNLQPKKGSKRPAYCQEAVVCVAKLTEAMPSQMASRMDELLPHLFSYGITPTLSNAMQSITDHLPEQRPRMQAHVLDAVCGALARMSFDDWARQSSQERAASFASTTIHDADSPAPAQVERSATLIWHTHAPP